jgi:maltose alpha-D-glucosyltransferase/alpha-amylase
MSAYPWYKNAVFYEVYVRAFFDSDGDGIGDIRGLKEKLQYLKELGVDCLWLLPIYPSPLQDDGYDIADYCSIHPDLGTLGDFKELLKAAHDIGLRVIIDLVLNHTSDQHPWFQTARSDPLSPYREYYVWSPTDQEYSQARIIFIDTEKSNWAWDEAAGQYYWHRFYSFQPDLNFDNPAVRKEILNIVDFWLKLGVDGFRADAVPYLFEREGTNCENLPETHAYLKELRGYVDRKYPGRVLLCEANQWPRDVLAYFGNGDEFHLAFNFPLMPRIFMALRQGDRSPIQWANAQVPAIPAGCQWCTFLRNHDELTLEMVTPEEREWMWREYAPDRRMRLNLGIRRRLAPLLDNDIRKIELANSLIFSLPGTPIIYYGDEIGMGDDIALPDRNGVRTPMQWRNGRGAGFSAAETLFSPLISAPAFSPGAVNVEAQKKDSGSLWHFMKKLISIRKGHPAFGLGDYREVDCSSKAVLGYFRSLEPERILVVNNLGREPAEIKLSINEANGKMTDLLSGKTISLDNGSLELRLKPYEFYWLRG